MTFILWSVPYLAGYTEYYGKNQHCFLNLKSLIIKKSFGASSSEAFLYHRNNLICFEYSMLPSLSVMTLAQAWFKLTPSILKSTFSPSKTIL